MREAQRDQQQRYRCRCVIQDIRFDDDQDEGRCHSLVNVDQPFCRACEDRHVNEERVLVGVIVVSEIPI